MKSLVEKFTNQLIDAIKIGDSVNLKKPNRSFDNITITGLGGSGNPCAMAQGKFTQQACCYQTFQSQRFRF